ncbi:MAG TPA: YggS family pyridoxal phosphate-dependent enzyme, partial [Treponema sp.]|nr:YggS family pyridoxal phosphate-dependent enzyme [Treponema sp.]
IEKKIEVFFEIHTGEDSKSGYKEKAVLLKSVENCANGIYPHIVPKGLMTMAPFTQDEKLIRASFSELRNLKDELNKNFPSLEINELSMGMSGDYKIAIEEGSTLVRIGTALFGERDYS